MPGTPRSKLFDRRGETLQPKEGQQQSIVMKRDDTDCCLYKLLAGVRSKGYKSNQT